MFHLLVAYQGWKEHAGEIATGRIYIDGSSPEFGEFRAESGILNVEGVCKIPALLMTEIGGSGPDAVKVARITSISSGTRFTTLHYDIDMELPLILNADIERLREQLKFGKYSLNHTHWEIVNFNLYRLLLIAFKSRQLSPTVFSFDNVGMRQDTLIAVMMPFGAEFTPVYASLQSAAQTVGTETMRADDLWEHQFIVQDIVSLIARSRLVICDCSGRNPNVFYEIGIAHSLGKQVILIVQNEADIPFDLRHIRYLRYLNNSEGLDTLGREIGQRIQTILGSS